MTINPKEYKPELVSNKVFFDEAMDKIEKLIDESDVVFGCIYGLSDYKVLDRLRNGVSTNVIVDRSQHDQLNDHSKAGVRSIDSKLPFWLWPGNAGRRLVKKKGLEVDDVDSVRFLGGRYLKDKNARPSSDLMHNKFLIFGKVSSTLHSYPTRSYYTVDIRLTKMVTGSCNISYNARSNHENIVVIDEPLVIQDYYNEFIRLLALSTDTQDNLPEFYVFNPEYRLKVEE